MAAHGAHAHAVAVHRDLAGAEVGAQTQDLVGFGHAFPFFARLAVAQILVDPRNQAAAQRHAEVGGFGSGQGALLGDDHAVDLEDGALWVIQQGLDFGVERAVLRQQLAHVLGTAAGSGLVGLRAHPLDQTGLVQRAHAHQHAADGAVAADPVLAAVGHGVLDDRHVDRVQHDDGVLFHAQGRGSIDPVAVPAGSAQLGEHLVGVVAALAGQDDVALLQCFYVVRVLERLLVLGHGGGSATSIGGGEEHGLDQGKVILCLHAVHQHGADHAAPAHQTYYVSNFHRAHLSRFSEIEPDTPSPVSMHGAGPPNGNAEFQGRFAAGSSGRIWRTTNRSDQPLMVVVLMMEAGNAAARARERAHWERETALLDIRKIIGSNPNARWC